MWGLLFCLLAANAQDRGARAEDATFGDDDHETYEPAPRDRLYFTNATFARVNPLGFVDLYRIGWRRRLSTKDSVLFHDTYSFVSAEVMATPAYSRVGIFAEAQVLAILRVFASYSAVAYYGTFDQVLSWPGPDARYSDQTIEAEGERASGTLGTVFTAGGTLRAAVGPIAVRSTLSLTRYDLDLPDGDTYFYDQYWDRLAPDGGWMALNDADVLALLGNARVGVRHTFTDEFGNDSGEDSALSTHRLGPLLAWQFHDKKPGTKFNQPTAFLVAQWWLQHPYRAGAEQPQALPLIAAGFAFNGDLAMSKD
ncbi:MAG: hypothetical protein EP330_21270 [Deltaproteobacteria bacterium]|nr:MAG: hypothetical protein EP330_21270 [Deltaproteobacteria bacterium]